MTTWLDRFLARTTDVNKQEVIDYARRLEAALQRVLKETNTEYPNREHTLIYGHSPGCESIGCRCLSCWCSCWRWAAEDAMSLELDDEE